MTIQELFEEYGNLAWMYHECVSDEVKEQRMAEIIQEVEALVRKETVNDIINKVIKTVWEEDETAETIKQIKEYAQSKGIIL